MDLVAPWHVGSSRTRARTRVPCIGRRTLNHCATREVPIQLLSVRIQAHMCLIPKPMLLSEVTSKFPVRKSNDFLNDNYILKLPSFKLHGAAFHTFFFPLCISAYCGFSYCGARALGVRTSVVVVCGLSSCGTRALEHRLSSCGTRA